MLAVIDLREATTIIDAALAHAGEIDCAPMTVAVLDPGGHLVALQRQDRSGILRVEIAFGKAWGALGMRLPSRDLARRAELLPHFVDAITVASGGRLIPIAGGVLVRRGADVLGAVGISGDSSENDEACAVAGITAAGLEPDVSSTEPW